MEHAKTSVLNVETRRKSHSSSLVVGVLVTEGYGNIEQEVREIEVKAKVSQEPYIKIIRTTIVVRKDILESFAIN